MNCKEVTQEMIDNNPDLAALQQLAYDGTPEEVCRNFKDHAFTALDKVIKKHTKSGQHDLVECERALHFFNDVEAAHTSLFHSHFQHAQEELRARLGGE